VIFLVAILTLALVALVVVVVGAPLWRARDVADAADREGEVGAPRGRAWSELEAAGVRDDLEAAREAKYREIRDADLDFRTGKLSREDYEAIDADLRAEAIRILDQLDASTPTDA
jgi:hypothetical protein